MTIGGVKVLDDISFEGVKIPKRVCIGVCAGTANGHSNMMCVNNVKIKGEDRAEEAAVDCGDESSEDEEEGVEVVVGVRVITDKGDKMRKVKLHCQPTTQVKSIVEQVNRVLDRTEGINMSIERLVPLWTPTWDHFDAEKKLIKLLKHSKDYDENDYDARNDDPVRMVGVDAEAFDADFWNEHLDFLHPEFEWLESAGVSETN